jgi:hypothetical protein
MPFIAERFIRAAEEELVASLAILLVLVLVISPVATARFLARQVGFVVPFGFIGVYLLGVGALTLINVRALEIADPKFKWLDFWLIIYWPFWTIIFAPSASSALLATWFSRSTEQRGAAMMLGAFFVLILIAIEMVGAFDPNGRHSFWPHLGAFAILSAIFFAIAQVARVRRAKERFPPRTP